MKAPTEGKAALEAAVDGMVSAEEWSSFWSRDEAGRLFLAGLRAYLGALSDTHRLVPLESTVEMDEASDGAGWPEQTWDEMIAKAPPAPGLEKEQEHD